MFWRLVCRPQVILWKNPPNCKVFCSTSGFLTTFNVLICSWLPCWCHIFINQKIGIPKNIPKSCIAILCPVSSSNIWTKPAVSVSVEKCQWKLLKCDWRWVCLMVTSYLRLSFFHKLLKNFGFLRRTVYSSAILNELRIWLTVIKLNNFISATNWNHWNLACWLKLLIEWPKVQFFWCIQLIFSRLLPDIFIQCLFLAAILECRTWNVFRA